MLTVPLSFKLSQAMSLSLLTSFQTALLAWLLLKHAQTHSLSCSPHTHTHTHPPTHTHTTHTHTHPPTHNHTHTHTHYIHTLASCVTEPMTNPRWHCPCMPLCHCRL